MSTSGLSEARRTLSANRTRFIPLARSLMNLGTASAHAQQAITSSVKTWLAAKRSRVDTYSVLQHTIAQAACAASSSHPPNTANRLVSVSFRKKKAEPAESPGCISPTRDSPDEAMARSDRISHRSIASESRALLQYSNSCLLGWYHILRAHTIRMWCTPLVHHSVPLSAAVAVSLEPTSAPPHCTRY